MGKNEGSGICSTVIQSALFCYSSLITSIFLFLSGDPHLIDHRGAQLLFSVSILSAPVLHVSVAPLTSGCFSQTVLYFFVAPMEGTAFG